MTEGQIAQDTSGSVYPLGRYVVLAELGRGGMAEVYLALARGPNGFNKLVVLKLLRSHLAEDEDFLKMFLAEARLAARLNHANIVQTYEIGTEGGRHCIVMEYLEGRSFAEVEAATRREPMALSLGVRVIADTLSALQHAHELSDGDGHILGLVHRDVSPHNVFVTYDGQVKLLDFGIAKAADDGARTKTGVFKGKLRYTAPERFAGEDSDRRSDIFSVGVMLWQILTKRRLWAGMNELTVMQQLAMRAPIPPPRSINPEVPERLDEICMKALAASPDDRFRTAAEMEDALEEFLASESVGATNRALAKYMGEVFGETRQQFQRTVEEQIRAAAHVSLDYEGSSSAARLRAEGAVPMLGSLGGESLSSIPIPTSSFRVRSGVARDPSSNPPATDEVVSPLEPAPAPRRRGWTGTTLVALLASAAILFLFVRADRPAVPPAPKSVLVVPTSPRVVAPAETSALPSSMTSLAPDPAVALDGAAGARHVTGAPVTASPAAARAMAPARARVIAPPQSERAAAPPPKAEPPKVDCSSPYFIDEQGLKDPTGVSMSLSTSSRRAPVFAARAFIVAAVTSMFALQAPRAGADEKSACVASYERSQVLRRDHRFQRAREELRSCSRVACPALVRNDCITWLDQVQTAFPSIAIRALKDGSDVANVKVIEDNEIVATRLDGSSLEVEPGEHNFRFETEGAPPVTLTLVVREREKDRLVPITFVSPHAATASEDAPSFVRPTPVGVYVLGGIGVAGLASFAALGAVGKNNESSLQRTCSPNCAQAQIDKVKTDYIAADISLGVGAAALVSAGVWYLMRPKHAEGAPAPKDGVAVVPSRGGALVGWSGTF